MKKLLLSAIVVVCGIQLSAQYTFSESSGTYTQLSVNADSITDPLFLPDWDDDWIRIGLPFQINMYGVWYDSAGVETNGELVLFNDWTGVEDPWYDVNDTVPCMMGFGEYFSEFGTGDLKSKGPNLSPILMEVTGTPGQQIMKLEWRNAGFYEDTSIGFTNYVNFQIWIHETSGNVEYHYGPSLIDLNSFGGSTGPTIGLATTDLTPDWTLFDGIYVTGTTTTEIAGTSIGQMTGQPADSTIYFFTNLATVGIQHIEKRTFAMYPNPAKEFCTLQLNNPESSVMVTDASGRIVMLNTAVNTSLYTLDLSGFDAGIYFVTVSGENGSSTQTLSVH